MADWIRTYEGKLSRETWTHENGCFRVIDRTVGWREESLRPYVVQFRNGLAYSRAGHLGFGQYSTAEAAMRAVERHLRKVAA